MVKHFSRTRKKIRVCRTTFLQPENKVVLYRYTIKPPFFLGLQPEKKSDWINIAGVPVLKKKEFPTLKITSKGAD